MKDITADMASLDTDAAAGTRRCGRWQDLGCRRAAGYALDSGWQVAVMAPTEILAEQHLLNFKHWFEPLGIGVGWLAGKQTAKQRREALEAVSEKYRAGRRRNACAVSRAGAVCQVGAGHY